MRVCVTNAQDRVSVNVSRMSRLARAAMRALHINGAGELAITFIDARRMRALNKRFLRHDRPTDVLSFRYHDEVVAGDILIDPTQARAYAARHRLGYEQELSRYVIHGLLHWMGHDDHSSVQQRAMRTMEDRVLARCTNDQRRGGAHQSHAPRPVSRAP